MPEVGGLVLVETASFAPMHAYTATTQAASNLMVRNARRKDQIDAAQQELMGAVIVIIVIVLVYTFRTFPLEQMSADLIDLLKATVEEEAR